MIFICGIDGKPFQTHQKNIYLSHSYRCKVGDKGVVQAEPRLEPKKYRRQSRKSVNQSFLDGLDELDEDDMLEDDNPILRAMREENQ